MDARWFRKYSDIVKEAEQLDELSPELLRRAGEKAHDRADQYDALKDKYDQSDDTEKTKLGTGHDLGKLRTHYKNMGRKFNFAARDKENLSTHNKLLRQPGGSSAALRKIRQNTNTEVDDAGDNN